MKHFYLIPNDLFKVIFHFLNILDIMKGIVDQAIDTKPVIRLAQGTKITIMVTSDLRLPAMKKR